MRRSRLKLEQLESRELPSTFFVSKLGADTNPGTATLPFLTIQKASDTVQPGDIVDVLAGRYTGFDVSTSGLAASPITFHAEPGVFIVSPEGQRNLDGINVESGGAISYINIDGFNCSNLPEAGIRVVSYQSDTVHGVGVRLTNNVCDSNGVWGIFTGYTDDIVIQGNVTSNSIQQHGIYVSNSSQRPTIDANTAFGNHDVGIQINADVSAGGTGITLGALIENNVIYDNGLGGGAGINLDGVQNSIIQNNLIYNEHANGMVLYQGDGGGPSKNNTVRNNTVQIAPDGRWCVNIATASTGNHLDNNILLNFNAGHGAINIDTPSLPGLISNYNSFGPPLFTVDDGGANYNLAGWQQLGFDLQSTAAPDILSTDSRMEGTQVGNRVIMFGHDGPLSGSAPVTYQFTGGTNVQNLLVDLQAGTTYQVNINGTLFGSFAASAQGSISFTTTGTGTQTVTVAPSTGTQTTTTAVSSSVQPSVSGQSITFTATVTPSGSGTPTGTVTFKDGTTTLGTATLSGGTGTFNTSALVVGSHSITAVYSGDSTFTSSASPALGQTINKDGSSAAVSSSIGSAVFGQSVTFTATIGAAAPGSGTPTGTVTFKDGTTTLGTATLAGGAATFTTSALAVGSHSITAVYGGDANFGASTSGALGQAVNQDNSAATVVSSANPTSFGQSVTFTATISAAAPGAGTPTGTVTFKDGTTTLGTGNLAGGAASFTTSSLAAGGHSITAVYGGDANFIASTSSALTQTVNQPAAFVVSNANDSGAGSLRQAILDANAATGAQTITFDPTFFTALKTINLLSSLPALNNPITIDATTLPNYTGTPLVEINGASAGNSNGIVINGSNSTIKGLAIDRFTYFGIALQSNGNTIQNDNIGVGPSGNIAAGNQFSGIFVSGNNNIIRNDTISANGYHGIQLQNGASGNTVAGNMIGVGTDGTTALGNTYDGVAVYLGAQNNTIGGSIAADRNVIGNNNRSGVLLLGPGTTGNQVNGNYIGTDSSGNSAEGNGIGVWMLSSAGNTVGNASGTTNNTISGNRSNGIQVQSSSTNLIAGNLIGVNQLGSAALGNKASGILLEGAASNNSISNNTVSGNAAHGVEIHDSGTMGNVLKTNRIGVNLSGTAAIGNSFDGVVIYQSASKNSIGSGNVISGNGRAGVTLTSPGTTGNTVSGSEIGVDSTGIIPLGNTIGVWIIGGATGNTIGGTVAGAGNIIASNSKQGVSIGLSTADSMTVGNAILGNSIYTNGQLGIDLAGDGVTGNTSNGSSSGPNRLENYPLLQSAVASGNSLVIQGVLNSFANTAFRLEFFANTTQDTTGHGQGRTYLGFINVTTNANYSAPFTATLTLPAALPAGTFVTATATDAYNNTSEFSQNIVSA